MRGQRHARRFAVAVAVAVVAVTVAGCGYVGDDGEPDVALLVASEAPAGGSSTPSPSPPPSPTRGPSVRPTPGGAARQVPSAAKCPYPESGFDCAMQQRIRAAERYAHRRPGVVAIVVRDRVTGAVWRNEYADRLIWAASTVKLAMAVDLLLRDRAGVIALTATDRDLIHRMLHVSDDAAASILWDRYGGTDYVTRFPSYGLVSTTFAAGLPHRWGRMKTTADDLDRLMGYVLDRLPPDLRAYVLAEMRSVGANQQWGVWGAGPGRHPGNKDGWAYANGGWNISSVGFAGGGERYTLAMMNDLRGQAGGDAGRATETEIARLLFAAP